MINLDQYLQVELSVALTDVLHKRLVAHLDKAPQEDLCFVYWRPSRGLSRMSAVIFEEILPEAGEREIHGNASFAGRFIDRVLAEVPEGSGVGFLHSHPGPGWQSMSADDVVAERDRLAGAVAGRTNLPLLGMTLGTDGSWSARYWLRRGRGLYERRWATSARVVGATIHQTFHPDLMPSPDVHSSQVATASVWGARAQADIARTHFGVVGLGSVGSIVAEALYRVGVQNVTLIDHDVVELRNLDRTLGATTLDADGSTTKVQLSHRQAALSGTANPIEVRSFRESVLSSHGYQAALDCDVLFSCVDRPWPRFLMNTIAYAHLIPVIDGGIRARVNAEGEVLHADWRIHAASPGRPCLVCLGALLRSDVQLGRDGLLDNPDYIEGLPPDERDRLSRRNVFPFSLSVAAHEVLQALGMVAGQLRLGGAGPQSYHCYPGIMELLPVLECQPQCEFNALTASAADLTRNLDPRL